MNDNEYLEEIKSINDRCLAEYQNICDRNLAEYKATHQSHLEGNKQLENASLSAIKLAITLTSGACLAILAMVTQLYIKQQTCIIENVCNDVLFWFGCGAISAACQSGVYFFNIWFNTQYKNRKYLIRVTMCFSIFLWIGSILCFIVGGYHLTQLPFSNCPP